LNFSEIGIAAWHCQQVKKICAHFWRSRAKNPGCMGEQYFCIRVAGTKIRPVGLFASIFLPPGGKKDFRCNPGRMGGRPFCATNAGLRPRPACTALKKIATSRDAWRAAILSSELRPAGMHGEQQFCLQNCDQPLAPHGLFALRAI
jgi:hypothetical protein